MKRVDEALFRQLMSYSATPLLGSAIGSFLVAISQINSNEIYKVIGWLSLVYLSLAIRIWLTYRVKIQLATTGYDPIIARRYALTTSLSGMAWGSSAFLIIDSTPISIIITTIAVQSMVMGGVLTLGTFIPAFLAFTIPTILPMILVFAFSGGIANIVLALYSAIFLVLMISITFRYNKSLRNTWQITFEKDDLIKSVTKEQENVLAAKLEADQAIKELEAIHHNIWVGIVILNSDRIILRANRHFEEIMFRWNHGEMIGKTTRIIYSCQKDYDTVGRTIYPQLSSGKNHYKFESSFARKDGTTFWGIAVGSFIDPNDLSKGAIWFIHDVDEEHQAQEQLRIAKELAEKTTEALADANQKILFQNSELEHIAHHDTLTGLPNRQLLADRMKQAIAHSKRTQGKVAVLYLDLDGFKPINDLLGHTSGDLALCEVTQRLNGVMRSEDTLARVGGDEFVILLSNLNENATEVAELVANKCLSVFHESFFIRNQPCKMGTSIGIAIGDGNCSSEKLLIAADVAMYRAKESGRGQFCWTEDHQ